MKSILTRALASLLALLLAAALLGGCAGGETGPAQVTPATKPNAAASPEAVKPDAPQPVGPEPAPTAAAPSLADALGVWELYSSEVEGDLRLASDTGSRSWLIVRDCARADYVEAQPGFEAVEFRNCPLAADENGFLRLVLEEDEYGRECELIRADADELELSFSFRYSDGTQGGSQQVFRRLQEPTAEFSGTAVSPRELRQLNDRANTTPENGFFQCSFSRPQEIDWNEVFYNGAGIDCEPSEAALEDFQRQMDEDWDCPIICFTETAMTEFVWNKTLTSYAEAEKQIWSSWETSDGYVLASHGDTNFMPVEITAAYAEGEIYQLCYERADFANFVWEPVPFVMTLRIHNGEWQYISNERADAPSALLLTVDYFDEKEDVPESMQVREFVDTPPFPSDEPSWRWAVLTAREDGVRYSIDRADLDYDESDYFLVMFLDRYIGDNVSSGVLNKGESVAVKVNTPWYPTIRVMATKDTYYGELWFGETGMLHIFDNAARRYVAGHDVDAEGRGCDPDTENQLMAFLCGGDWFYLDPETQEPVAVMYFPYGHSCMLEWSEGWYEFTAWYFHEDEDRGGPPDTISLYRGGDDNDWSLLPDRLDGEDKLGSYTWTAYQLDGEQILNLDQLELEPGPLSYLLPGATENTKQFTFVRFTGATLEEAQG